MRAANRKTINTRFNVSSRRKLLGTVKCYSFDEVVKGHSVFYVKRDCTIVQGDKESYLRTFSTYEGEYCCQSCGEEDEYKNRKERCILVEEMLRNNGAVSRLKNLVLNGVCVGVVGKNIVNINNYFGDSLEDKLSLCYQDQTVVFDQEMCLYTMLVLKEENYPWRL